MRQTSAAGAADRHRLERIGPAVRVGRRAAIAPLAMAIVGASAMPSIATGASAPTCDATCAKSTVHHPGKATTLSVRWKHYPYASQSNPAATDRWGSTERQCTGYATWALNAMGIDFGMTDRGRNGRVVRFLSASHWARAARRGGWIVSHKPVIGSVAQWNARETSHWRLSGVAQSASAGRYGHVGIVTKIYHDGTVLVRQYNAGSPGRSYSRLRAKAPRYLYLGVK